LNKYKIGDADTRPWGDWIVTDAGAGFVVKRITVRSDARLSLQFHYHRQETWVIVAGRGIALIGDEQRKVKAGDVVQIGPEIQHRMSNPFDELLVFIEIQLGENLDEADIIRIQDDFGRQ